MKKILVILLLLISAYKLFCDDNINFRGLNGEGIKFVRTIVENKQGYLFVNSSTKGIVRSSNKGKTWSYFNKGLPEESVNKLVIGTDDKIFALPVSGGIYTSTDNGISWLTFVNELSDKYITNFLIHKSGYYFAASDHDDVGLRRSKDKGLTWERIDSTFQSNYIYNLISNSQGEIFISCGIGKIYRSSDLGDSWSLIQSDSSKLSITTMCAAHNNDIIVGTEYKGTYIIKNGTDKLIKLNDDLKDKNIITINLDSLGNIYAGLEKEIYILNKDYSKWAKVFDSVSVFNMYISPKNEKYIGYYTNLFLYDETENKWKNLNNSIFLDDKKILSILPRKNGQLVIGTIKDGLYFLQSENNLVEKRDSGLQSGKIGTLYERNSNEIFAYIDSIGVYFSDDTCHSWKQFNNGLENHIVKSFLSLNNGDMLAATDDGIDINHPGDSVWNESNAGLTDKNINCLLLTPDNKIFTGTEKGKIYISTDNGFSWAEAGTLPKNDKPVTSLIVNSKGIIIAGTYGNGIYRSYDNGETWKAINLGLRDFKINSIVVTNEDDLIISTPTSIYYSSINGDYWIKNGYTNLYPLIYQNDKIYAGSSRSGVLVADSIIRTINQSKGGWINKDGYVEQTLKVGDITYIKYSIDGKYLYTFGIDTVFRKWDVETGNVIEEHPLFNYYEISDIDFDEKSNLLAIANYIGNYGQIVIYDIVKDSILLEIEPGNDYSPPINGYSSPKVAFDISHNKIYTGITINYTWGGDEAYGGRVDSWNLWTGNHIKEYKELIYDPYWLFSSSGQNNLFFSGVYKYFQSEGHGGGEYFDYKSIVITSNDSIIDLNNRIRQLAVSPNEKYFAASTDSSNEIFLYDYNNLNILKSWSNGYSSEGYCPISLVFSKDEKYLISSSTVRLRSRFIDSDSKNFIRIWQAETGHLLDSIEFQDYHGLILAASPDSLSIAAATTVGYIEGMNGLIRIIKPKIFTQKLKSFFVVDSVAKSRGGTIHFKDSSIGKPISWFWDFGDGTTIFEHNPSHQYSDTGSYDIIFITSDGTNIDTLIKKEYIHITSPVIADFEANPSSGIYPLTVKFKNKSSGNAKYFEWSYVGNIFSSDIEPEYTFNGYGNYIVKMVVSDGYFCDSVLKEINVHRAQSIPPVIFEKDYFSNSKVEGYKGIECNEGGFIISGICTTYTGPINDIVYIYKSELYRLDIDGNYLWSKVLNYGEKVTQLSDGNFLLLGRELYDYYYYNNYNFMIKISQNGDSLWSKSIEKPDSSIAMNIKQINNGYLIVGYYFNGDSNTFITKYDNDGNKIWTKFYPGKGGKIMGQYDDGYLIFTFDENSEFNIIKTDKNFNIDWINASQQINGFKIGDFALMKNGNLALVGTDVNSDMGKIYIIDTKSKIMSQYTSQTSWYHPLSIVILDDSLFAVACYSYYDWAGFSIFNYSGKLINDIRFTGRKGYFNYIDKTRAKEIILTGTVEGSNEIENIYFVKTLPYDLILNFNYNNQIPLIIYPNPTNGPLSVNYYLDKESQVRIKLFSSNGEEIGVLFNEYQFPGDHSIILQEDLSNLAIGVYFLQLITNDKTITTILQITR